MEIVKDGWKIQIDENLHEELRWKVIREFNKKPALARFLLYIFLNEPCTITDLTYFASKVEKINYERMTVYRIVNKLAELGLVSWITPLDFMDKNNPKSELYEKAREKYKKIIETAIDSGKTLKRIKLTRFIYMTEYGKSFFDVVKRIVENHFGGKIRIVKLGD